MFQNLKFLHFFPFLEIIFCPSGSGWIRNTSSMDVFICELPYLCCNTGLGRAGFLAQLLFFLLSGAALDGAARTRRLRGSGSAGAGVGITGRPGPAAPRVSGGPGTHAQVRFLLSLKNIFVSCFSSRFKSGFL
jgi:hypothetical protein